MSNDNKLTDLQRANLWLFKNGMDRIDALNKSIPAPVERQQSNENSDSKETP